MLGVFPQVSQQQARMSERELTKLISYRAETVGLHWVVLVSVQAAVEEQGHEHAPKGQQVIPTLQCMLHCCHCIAHSAHEAYGHLQ